MNDENNSNIDENDNYSIDIVGICSVCGVIECSGDLKQKILNQIIDILPNAEIDMELFVFSCDSFVSKDANIDNNDCKSCCNGCYDGISCDGCGH